MVCQLILYHCTIKVSIDIDECAIDNDLCGQVCVNTAGSYFCSCEDGFQLVEGSSQCEGIPIIILCLS